MDSRLRKSLATGMAAVSCLLMAGCTPDYSPNTYASNAAQQANKVNQGIVVGVRAVQISADTTLAMASGGAAGGVAGSTIGGGATSALGAVGGTVAGGVVGNVLGHAAGDTAGFEYIVKKDNGDLLSVTQKDLQPLGVGAHVLVIEGPQARIVPDYTVPVVVQALHPEPAKPAVAAKTEPAVTPAATPAAVTTAPLPAPAQPEPIAVNPPPVEQKPVTPAETPAAKPEDTVPKPASGS